MLLFLLSLVEDGVWKGSRGSSVPRGEPVSLMTEEVIDAEDFSYHGSGVGVRGKWEPGLGRGGRICGPLPPGNFSPPIQFLFISHSLHF